MFYKLKISLRNLQRGGIYSAINIAGLAIGMAAAILIFVWIYNEWSYDRFHTKEKQLYQVWSRASYNGPIECWTKTSTLLGPSLKESYPEIAEMTRLTDDNSKDLYASGDKRINLLTRYADPGFLTMFSFPLLAGDKKSALNDPYSIILTEKAAKRFFGEEDALGKVILYNMKYPMTVTGVMKDLPPNTSFDFEALTPFTFTEKLNWYAQSWGAHSVMTYVELKPKSKENTVNESIKELIKKQTNGQIQTEPFIYPLSNVHLYSKFENGVPAGGKIESIRLLGLIALLVLLIACINFVNLSTARSEKRAKEVGIRKVMGGKRKSLIRQFLGESMLVALIAGFIAIFLVELTLPPFSTWMGKTLTLDFSNGWFWLCSALFILITGLIAGAYPAFYLSSFLPVKVLKGTYKKEKTLVAPRKILIIVQFISAIFLITSTLVIHRQLMYAKNRDNGYNKEHLIYHPMSGELDKNYTLLKQDLINSGAVLSVTRTFAPMTQGMANTPDIKWKGSNPDDKIIFDLFFVDSEWTKTVGTKITEGRDIDISTYSTDSTAALINQTAAKTMNFKQPIGEEIQFWGQNLHVVGVIKDFILHSPYDPIVPMIIAGPATAKQMVYLGTMHIRLNPANKTADNLSKVAKLFKKYNPDYPFEYQFIDEEYARKFQDEQRTGSLATGFAVLTILISYMGLFALVAYMVETRRKEIGIRKVFGASVTNVVFLLSKEFLILVLISIVIVYPIAWWTMDKWLSKYAYRTDIPWWLFVVVGLISIFIALVTVGWQAIKAATANPVKAIKTE